MQIAVEDYRRAQEVLWPGTGAWAHDRFSEINRRYFANEIPARGVLCGLTPQNSLSHTDANGRITLNPALLDPSDGFWRRRTQPYLGEGHALDVLVHEMVHSLLRARGVPAGRDGDHNLPEWCAEVTRLAPMLGLSPVLAAPVTPTRQREARHSAPGRPPEPARAGFPWALRR